MNDIYNLFPEPIVSYTLGREFTSTEKNALLSQDWGRSEGNETSKNTFVLDKKNLENIREFIRLSISDFGRTVYDFSDEKTKLYITQSWMNKTMPGEFHHPHKHPNSIVSGTFYIETNDLVFNKNHKANLMNICKKCHEKVTKEDTVYVRKKTMKGYSYVTME